MNSRKHRKLKRHPFVRFIRGVFRLFRVLFRPTKSTHRLDSVSANILEDSNRRHDPIAADRIEELTNPAVHSFDRDRLMTVGELLDRVKWQSPQEQIQPKIAISNDPRTQDVSRN